jgi:hypothetical protein
MKPQRMNPKKTETTKAKDSILPGRKFVNDAYLRLVTLLKAEGMEEESISMLKSIVERMNRGLFRLVVMGEREKGKSSFINALVQQPDLLPTDTGLCTSTVCKIIYGTEKRIKVFFREDSDTGVRQKPLAIESSQLPDYATEGGNADDKAMVDFIGMQIPCPLLKEGLAIIDTPGVGSIVKDHRDVTWRYAPNADAIFFVLDSTETLLGAEEVEFLKQLTEKHTKRIFFIQTKTDASDGETVRGWEKRNKEILLSEVGIPEKSLVYFCVSSTLKNKADHSKSGKRLHRSGFSQVIDFLHRQLIPRKDEELVREAIHSLLSAADHLRNSLQESKRIFSMNSEEENRKIQKEFSENKTDFDEWSRRTFPRRSRGFNNDFDVLRRKFRDGLQHELDPNGIILQKFRERLEEESTKKISENANRIIQDEIEHALVQTTAVLKNFEGEAKKLMNHVLHELDAPSGLMPNTDSPTSKILIPESTNPLTSQVTGMDKARGMFSGFSMGLMAGGLITAVAFPPVGVAAPIIGALTGAFFGRKDIMERERQSLLRALEMNLKETLSSTLRQAHSKFDEFTERLRRQFSGHLEELKDIRESELTARLDELGKATKLSNEDKVKKNKEIQTSLKQSDAIMQHLSSAFKLIQNER